MTYVQLWIDDHRLGCGERGFFVVQRGHKWVSLYYAPRDITTKVEVKFFDRHAKPAAFQKGKMRALIKEVAARGVPEGTRPKLSKSAQLVMSEMKSR